MLPSYTSLPTVMRTPPSSAGFCANDVAIPLPYRRARPASMLARTSSGRDAGALHARAVSLAIEPDQALKPRQHLEAAGAFRADDLLDDAPDAGLVERSVHQAQPEKPLRLTLLLLSWLFMPASLDVASPTSLQLARCLAVSSASLRSSSGVSTLPTTADVV